MGGICIVGVVVAMAYARSMRNRLVPDGQELVAQGFARDQAREPELAPAVARR
jgi:hypothetical protein